MRGKEEGEIRVGEVGIWVAESRENEGNEVKEIRVKKGDRVG